MVTILTKRDLAKNRKNAPLISLKVTEDFKHYPHNMPEISLYPTISKADTLLFLGNADRRYVHPDECAKIFHINKLAGTGIESNNEKVIATIIRQLSHEGEVKIDWCNMVKEIAASLTSQECADMAVELEKEAILKA